MKRTLTIAAILFIGACQGPPPETESQAAAVSNTPPAPTPAPPGSLGGICGVNYANCQTKSETIHRFSSASRTLTTGNIVQWTPTDPVGRFRGTTWTLWITRLINDHTLPQDKIVASISESDYGVTFNDSGAVQLTLSRNGYMVAVVYGKQNGHNTTNISSFADLHATWSIDYKRGGAETVLAWLTTPNLEGLYTAAMNYDNGSLHKSPSTPSHCDYWQGDCFYCKFSKYATIGLGSALTGGLGAEMGGMAYGAAAGAAGNMVATLFGDLFDCGKRCAAQACTKTGCMCFQAARDKQDTALCEQQAQSCCDNVGGYSTRGGECFGGG